MKRTILVLCVGIFTMNMVSAQFEYGLRLGMSTQDVNTEALSLQNNSFSDLKISLGEASYGYHVGLYTQFKLAGITISPEITLNSNTYEYRLNEFNESGGVEKIIQDQYQYVDIPILFGIKLGPLRAYAGPEAHYFINSFSKLADENGFEEQVTKLQYGAIAGAGLNVGKLRLDVRYELNFSNFEDHILYNNEGLDFNSDDSRLIFSLGYKLN
ncbi:porin family protein [Portibacter lacus]|nr:porin family protein [Portibacter lacus]